MDNVSRSERSRKAAIQAALTIITRDGPGRLTLDAIARESGMSKGGLMHQFPTKEAVLRALIEHQVEFFENFSRRYLAEQGADGPEPRLAAQLATIRQSITEPNVVAPAVIGVLAGEPGLMSDVLKSTTEKLDAVREEAADPDLACLRWAGAMGLALSSMLGICPFSEEERARLFDRLSDPEQWSAPEKSSHKSSIAPSIRRKGRGQAVRPVSVTS
jgi:AcrR family transcriptional regulator